MLFKGKICSDGEEQIRDLEVRDAATARVRTDLPTKIGLKIKIYYFI